jgi:hypothetical protein
MELLSTFLRHHSVLYPYSYLICTDSVNARLRLHICLMCTPLSDERWLAVRATVVVRRRRSQHGHTALMYAAVSGHADCARLLIDAGADKEATSGVRRRSLLYCTAPSVCFSVSLSLLSFSILSVFRNKQFYARNVFVACLLPDCSTPCFAQFSISTFKLLKLQVLLP